MPSEENATWVRSLERPAGIAGVGVACALGVGVEACVERMASGVGGLKRLDELAAGSHADWALDCRAAWPGGGEGALAGWIGDRLFVEKGRRYGAAANLGLVAARQAVAEAGWSDSERAGAWIFAGTSRGNAGEVLGQWKRRRPVRKFAASNTLHSEVAAAVSIQLGVRGPWQVYSNGCSSGLDALGWAALAVDAGWVRRALVLAVDLPLVPPILDDFAATGLLGSGRINDPYTEGTDGFHPGEAAAALALESGGGADQGRLSVGGYVCNADAHDAVALPEEGETVAQCLRGALEGAGGVADVAAVCPHATGTANHRVAEGHALNAVFSGARKPLLLPLKPQTGHSLGASGLLDVALLAGWARQGALPPVLPGLTSPGPGWTLPATPMHWPVGEWVLKLAAGMGGHNAAVMLRRDA